MKDLTMEDLTRKAGALTDKFQQEMKETMDAGVMNPAEVFLIFSLAAVQLNATIAVNIQINGGRNFRETLDNDHELGLIRAQQLVDRMELGNLPHKMYEYDAKTKPPKNDD